MLRTQMYDMSRFEKKNHTHSNEYEYDLNL